MREFEVAQIPLAGLYSEILALQIKAVYSMSEMAT